MKRIARWSMLLSICTAVLLAGCTPAGETNQLTSAPTPTPTVDPTSVPGQAERLSYAMTLGGTLYEVGADFSSERLFTQAECTEIAREFSFPAGRLYEKEGLTVRTFLKDDGTETLVSLCTWDDGQTPAGSGIGTTLEELKAAYPKDLVYRDGACGNGTEPVEYSRLYTCYRSGDGTNYAYNFYLNEKKVVMVEVFDSLDTPRDWSDRQTVLGNEHIRWEVLSDRPANPLVRYFIEGEDGNEETVLEVPGATEAHDLDGDGVYEILAYLSENNRQALGIYDSVDNSVIYTDVNKTLGSDSSGYMGLIANLGNGDYQTCVEAGFGDKSKVYSYADGKLTYECTFEEAMG